MIVEFHARNLSVTIDVDHGARLTSLREPDGFEWLAQGDHELLGWNEVAPSISPVRLHDGTDVPDHGDAMRLPWVLEERSDDAITLSVRLASVPVTLRRSIVRTSDGLVFEYRAKTESTTPVPFLWSAHPLFQGEGARIVGASTMAATEEYPRNGAHWPTLPADPFDSLGAGHSLKVFPTGPTRAVALSRDERLLKVNWDATQLPWVGLFWDDGEFVPGRSIAIEPCTGYGDSLLDATATQRVLSVVRARPLVWSLTLSTTPAAGECS